MILKKIVDVNTGIESINTISSVVKLIIIGAKKRFL